MKTRRKRGKKLSPYRRLEEELANARCALGNAVDKFMASEKECDHLFKKLREFESKLLLATEGLNARQTTLDRMSRTDHGVRDALGEALSIIDAMQKDAGWRLLPGPMVKRLEEIRRLL